MAEQEQSSNASEAKKGWWARISPYVYVGIFVVGVLNFYQTWTGQNAIRRENDLIMRENDKLDHNDRTRDAYQMLGLKTAAIDNAEIGGQIKTAWLDEKERGARYREICKRRGIALPPDLSKEREVSFPDFVKVAEVLLKYGDPNWKPPPEPEGRESN